MKIRNKLLLSFGLYIFLAVIFGLIGYKELRTITKRLLLVEIAGDMTNTMLEVRRYEKNYLLYKDNVSLKELRDYLGKLKLSVDNIEIEIIKEIGVKNFNVMSRAMKEYEHTIDDIVENFKLQGEISTLASDTGSKIEKRLTGQNLRSFLNLRKQEKIVMIKKDQIEYDTFKKLLTESGLNGEIERYQMLIAKLYEFYSNEKVIIETMRSTAREVQSFTQSISKRERANINSILSKAEKFLPFSLLLIIIIGVIINTRLAVSISRPIQKLEKITKKVAQGDFSEVIEVKGKDEIASLQISFNQMEEMLRDAMSALEQTVARLQEKQAQLVEAEKLASIGKLAAGIAHEINNPLTSVLTFSSLLLEQMPEDDSRHERLKIIVQEARRARNIVRQVLSFAKEAPLRTERINVNRPVTEIVDALIAQEAFKGIELSLDLSDNLPEIYIDPVQIGQVVLNILLNAAHAITPPGKIHVSTRAADNFIELIISDTGKGIPEEHLKKIFDPFFTTKGKSKGSGLGLAVSYGIIKKHKGDIEVRSTVNEGSTFIVRLPAYG